MTRATVYAAAMRCPRWLAGSLVSELAVRLGGRIVGWLRGLSHLDMESRLRGIVWAARYQVPGLVIERSVQVDGERVQLGSGVILRRGVYLNANGASGSIRIGEGSQVDRYSVLYGQGGIEIGEGCAIAAGTLIYSQTNRFDLAPETPILAQGTVYEAVRIGDDVWIGAGAIIVPGASIGDHAVIGAGAVVRGSVDPWQIAVGVPARALRDRREPR